MGTLAKLAVSLLRSSNMERSLSPQSRLRLHIIQAVLTIPDLVTPHKIKKYSIDDILRVAITNDDVATSLSSLGSEPTAAKVPVDDIGCVTINTNDSATVHRLLGIEPSSDKILVDDIGCVNIINDNATALRLLGIEPQSDKEETEDERTSQ